MEKVRIGITIGDINGIGPEVILKAVRDERLLDQCSIIIYGSSKVVSYHKNIVGMSQFNFQSVGDVQSANPKKVCVVNCWQDNANISLGRISEEGGRFAYIALDRATRDLKDGLIDALVTAPINKKAMKLANFPYPGHTEYLSKNFGANALMLMSDDKLKVAVATGHVALKDVEVNAELLEKKIRLLHETMKSDFGLDRPKIAVLGLNPHAGDGGEIGSEDDEILTPVIIELKKKGLIVSGPHSADGYFGSMTYQKTDATLAMYHDQGLIPFKSLAFHSGVNYTAGLPIIRTSPDHGTAFDIAGQNLADELSMRNAIYLAVDAYRNRKTYREEREDPMEKNPKPSEDNSE